MAVALTSVGMVLVVQVGMMVVLVLVAAIRETVGGHERYGGVGEAKGEEGDWGEMAKGRRRAIGRDRGRPPPTDTRSTCT